MMITTYKIATFENQHGYGVGMIKYIDGLFDNGFTLTTFPTKEEQLQYSAELNVFTGWEFDETFG